MKTEEKFKELGERAQSLVHQAQRKHELINRVHSNCRNMQYGRKRDWLRDLNARGTHLEDPVYQKLERVNRENSGSYSLSLYSRDALERIGNRRMDEEEYNMILESEDEELVSSEKIRYIEYKIRKRRESGEGDYSPHVISPRRKHDIDAAQKLGYYR